MDNEKINKDIDLKQIHKCLGHLYFSRGSLYINQTEEAIESISRSIELLLETFPECVDKIKKKE